MHLGMKFQLQVYRFHLHVLARKSYKNLINTKKIKNKTHTNQSTFAIARREIENVNMKVSRYEETAVAERVSAPVAAAWWVAGQLCVAEKFDMTNEQQRYTLQQCQAFDKFWQ